MVAVHHRGRCARLVRCATVALVLAAVASAGLSSTASAAVDWTSQVFQAPTQLPADGPAVGRGMVRIVPANRGNTAAGTWPTVTFTLPAGVTIASPAPSDLWTCTGVGTPQAVTCTNALSATGVLPYRFTGTPQDDWRIHLVVDVAPGAPQGSFPLNVTLTNADDVTIQTHELRVGGGPPLPFGPTPGTFAAGVFDQTGADYTQAGGHPYQATGSFALNTRFIEPTAGESNSFESAIRSVGDVADVVVDLPAGFVGDPSVGPKCPDLGHVVHETCPAASQVGVAATVAPPINSFGRAGMFGIYNLTPPDDAPAQFAFQSPIGTVVLTPILRSDGDWGVSAHVRNITQADVIIAGKVTLWGVPADPSHDAQRCAYPNAIVEACVGVFENGAAVGPPHPADAATAHSSGAPVKLFLTNPTECTGQPVVTNAHFSQYQAPGDFEPDGDPDLTDSDWVNVSASSPAVTGCDKLAFDPSVVFQPTDHRANSPTGLHVELRVPQNDDPNGLASAHLKDTTVVLPEGMTVNPAAANGLGACSSAQIGLTSSPGQDPAFDKDDPRDGKGQDCPLSSKVGSVEVDTPLLDDPLKGEVFLAKQADNPFESLLGVYIVVRGPGLIAKLAGHVEADDNGRLTTTVVDNPQLPFDKLTLDLESGPRAPLTTPGCGVHMTTATLTSWAAPATNVVATDSFQITEGPGGKPCPSGALDPKVSSGTTNPAAGELSPFVFNLTRDDGSGVFTAVDVKSPRGLSAKLAGVPYCPESVLSSFPATPVLGTGQGELAAPACPAASRIGSVTVGAGAGPAPFYPLGAEGATGRVYLAGPYKGAPLSLVIVAPAVAGPFDLGTVVVRNALHVDMKTAQVTAVGDAIPTVLSGIPLNVRDVQVKLDRPGFIANPSDCSAKSIESTVHGIGSSVKLSNRFQAKSCKALDFKPKLALSLTGRNQRTTGKHPGVKAQVTQTGFGEAGIKKAVVRLPKSLALDPANAQALCEFADGTKDDLEKRCPKASIVGRARAVTPLLDNPLVGNVYFVKNIRRDPRTGNEIRTLPMIVVALRGQIGINLYGRSSTTKGGKLVNTFADVPDAPITRFNLNLVGGKNGILAVTRTRRANINLCSAGKQIAEADMDGQNGRRHDFDVVVKTPCPKRKGAARKR